MCFGWMKLIILEEYGNKHLLGGGERYNHKGTIEVAPKGCDQIINILMQLLQKNYANLCAK
jgi:hypothetical protein